MHLLDVDTSRLVRFDDASSCEPYAILSHRWGEDEVQHREIHMLTQQDNHAINQLSEGKLKSINKLKNAMRKASESGLQYLWCDICCIDQSSSSELTEAINSMYDWYAKAEVCIVYLVDQGRSSFLNGKPIEILEKDKKTGKEIRSTRDKSTWFTRGWTLQELVAPRRLEFYDCDWQYIGSKSNPTIQAIVTRHTNIPLEILLGTSPLSVSIPMRMSWAAGREVTKKEDLAYSLLGLFGVNMPLLYGEGAQKAFVRLQQQIMLESLDHSMFAWTLPTSSNTLPTTYHGLLADSPAAFTRTIGAIGNSKWMDAEAYQQTNRGLGIFVHLRPQTGHPNRFEAALNCKVSSHSDKYHGIVLQRLGYETRQYARVECDKILALDSDPAGSVKELIYVRQSLSSFDHKSVDWRFLVPRNLYAEGYTLRRETYSRLKGPARQHKPRAHMRNRPWLSNFDDNGYLLSWKPFKLIAILVFARGDKTLSLVFITTADLEVGCGLLNYEPVDIDGLEQRFEQGTHPLYASKNLANMREGGHKVRLDVASIIDYPRCLYVTDISIAPDEF